MLSEGSLRQELLLLAAVVSGALVALQQRLNGDLGSNLHDPLLAAVVSFGGGLVLMCALLLRPAARASLRCLRAVPWWSRLGGLCGATLVAVGAVAAPEIGVALFTVGMVSGATVTALAVDRAGLGPGGRRELTTPRLVGALLCFAAIALSAREGLRAASLSLLVLVVAAGGLVSVQQALNGRVRGATDATVATFVNFVVGTTALLAALAVQAAAGRVHAVHWPTGFWLYLGGPLGCAFIAVAAVAVSVLGVLRLGLAVTAGQLLGG
ncbi:MAG: bacterial/archaeal transporter family-2 protein, partial [Frankiales bacterium]|nr:bacterial/archaeal transporter family-2 protein [Frankiales bacterium]